MFLIEVEGCEIMRLSPDGSLQNIKVPEPNMYIANTENAVQLLADLIRNEKRPPVHRIEKLVNQLFALFSEISLDDELALYEQFMALCTRLTERQKIQKIQHKAVVSFGGKFSAGKSRFINSICGIQNLLPVAQAPTTSIPTYIIKSDQNALYANSIYGYTTSLTEQSLGALTHEFYNVYGIGFSAFIDSIIVESRSFSLPEGIALLDTPGYTKYDEKSSSKMTLSDRQRAFDQLRISDYLIWLVDIDNGGLNKDDIDFLESLHIKTKVLIVFTKADLKPAGEIQEILELANETIQNTSIDCFGITAYSSTQAQEYVESLIPAFFQYVVSDSARSNNIRVEFRRLEEQLRTRLIKASSASDSIARDLFTYLTNSQNVLQIRSLADLWGSTQQDRVRLDELLVQYDEMVSNINREILNYMKPEA